MMRGFALFSGTVLLVVGASNLSAQGGMGGMSGMSHGAMSQQGMMTAQQMQQMQGMMDRTAQMAQRASQMMQQTQAAGASDMGAATRQHMVESLAAMAKQANGLATQMHDAMADQHAMMDGASHKEMMQMQQHLGQMTNSLDAMLKSMERLQKQPAPAGRP